MGLFFAEMQQNVQDCKEIEKMADFMGKKREKS